MTIDTSPEALAEMRAIAQGARLIDPASIGTFSARFGAPGVLALIVALEEARANLKAAMVALEPFALNADAISLSSALGHVKREHLLAARDLLTQLKYDEYEKSKNAK